MSNAAWSPLTVAEISQKIKTVSQTSTPLTACGARGVLVFVARRAESESIQYMPPT